MKINLTKVISILMLVMLFSFSFVFFYNNTDAQEPTIKIMRTGYPEKFRDYFINFIEEYEASHPDVKLGTVECGWNDMYTRLPIWTAAKTGGPDVFLINASCANYAMEGALLPLDDVLDEELKKVIPEEALNDYRFDGKLYGIAAECQPFILWYNKNLFKQAGLNPDMPPRTWEELLDYAKQITEKTDAYGIGSNLGRSEDFLQMFLGALYLSATNKPWVDQNERALFNSPEGIKAIQFFVDLTNKYKVTQPNPNESSKGDIGILFKNGQLGMIIQASYIITDLEKITDLSSYETSIFAVAPVPKSPFEGKKAMSGCSVNPWVISAYTKYPEIAKDVLRELLTTKWQYQQDLALGLSPFREDLLSYDYPYRWIKDILYENVKNTILNTFSIPISANEFKMRDILFGYIQKAMSEKLTVEEALNLAADEINNL